MTSRLDYCVHTSSSMSVCSLYHATLCNLTGGSFSCASLHFVRRDADELLYARPLPLHTRRRRLLYTRMYCESLLQATSARPTIVYLCNTVVCYVVWECVGRHKVLYIRKTSCLLAACCCNIGYKPSLLYSTSTQHLHCSRVNTLNIALRSYNSDECI